MFMRVVFCGACNPFFNMKNLAAAVKREFLNGPEDQNKILLLLNGCRTGCLKPQKFKTAEAAGYGTVCVAGASVDGSEVEENQLTKAVINAVKACLARPTQGMNATECR